MARPLTTFTAAQRKRILSRWQLGRSATAIASEFGVARATMVRFLRDAGVDVVGRWWARHGSKHHFWRGGRVRVQGGYIGVHVDADSQFAVMGHRRHKDSNASAVYVLEHRLVMARQLRRVIFPHETVHHINGKRDDNRVDNLELRTGKHGKGVSLICGVCGSSNIVTKMLQ